RDLLPSRCVTESVEGRRCCQCHRFTASFVKPAVAFFGKTEQRKQRAEHRRCPLVEARTLGIQAISTGAGGQIVQPCTEAVPTEQPFCCCPRQMQIALLSGEIVRGETGLCSVAGFDGLLAQYGTRPTAAIPALIADEIKIP